MITLRLSAQAVATHNADAYVMLLDDSFVYGAELQELASRYYKPLPQLIETMKFSGRSHDTLVISGADGDRPVTLVLVGIGSINKPHGERLEAGRRAMGRVVRALERLKVVRVACVMPDEHWFAVDAYTLAKELTAAWVMATYHFDQYITDESRKYGEDYEITFVAPALLHDVLQVGLDHGLRLGYSVNQARHWCDLPSCVLTPTHMAEHAERIARSHDLACTVFTEKEIKAMGMGGLIAVSQGSAEECRFVVMEYRTTVPNAPTLALVGKGVTFDSGGLSIKPAARMDEMKDDMAGGAAVISTMELVAHLKPSVNIIGCVPLTENLPSGTAVKPGDVVTFYNGKTAEIKNTDAEGRLILADALSYVVKQYAPDAIINVATLTGSCAYALGPFFCGLMSQHEDLAEQLLAASRRSGDRAWPLPFHDDYKPAVRSTVADLCNEGSATYRAGAITAGFFLQNFVGNTPWVHLDIAGTSFNVPDISYYRPGATGFGVRLFAEFVMHWARESR